MTHKSQNLKRYTFLCYGLKSVLAENKGMRENFPGLVNGEFA